MSRSRLLRSKWPGAAFFGDLRERALLDVEQVGVDVDLKVLVASPG
jgi:hypothetical protein